MEAWGRGGKVAGSEAGGGSRARLTPGADPFMLRRAKTEKRVNYPKRGPPTQVPPFSALARALSTVPEASGCRGRVPCPHPLG